MILTEEQIKELAEVVKPVIEYLNNPETFHPHVKIIIDSTSAELVEGIASVRIDDVADDYDRRV